ncbi:MAG: alpha/beta fold hydrolase [Thermomicrobiales bacterium]
MGDKPVIAFVHGDFGNAESSFGKVVSEIGDEYRTLLLDRPGFEPGAEHPDRYTFVGDAVALLDKLSGEGVAAFHLVGHSYGALVALAVAVRAPERIKSLHLIEPPLLRHLDNEDAGLMMQRVEELQAAHRDDDLDATTTAFFEMIGASHVPERLRDTEEWEMLKAFAPRFARNEPPGEFPLEHWAALDPTIPVLVYSGGRSHPALQGVTRQLASTPRVHRHTHIPGAGHAVQMAGEPFVLPFLQEVAAAEAAWAQRRPGAPVPIN